MEYSKNRIVNMILRFIGSETINEMEVYANSISERKFIKFESESSLVNFFSEYMKGFYANHSLEEIESIRSYTGYEFNNINAILRNNWNYETNGLLTKEKEEDIRQFISGLSNIMNRLDSIPSNIVAYRGVSLNTFKEYGITDISELLSLKGQYLYENGFTSTSLIKDRSFFDRPLEYHEPCNIEIEYLIPEETNEVMPLINDDLSYSKVQSELLIDKGSLSKVLDVALSEDKTKAYIKVALIPKKIYDKEKNNDHAINR